MSAPPTLTRELLARYLAGDLESERLLFERFRAELLEAARRHRQMGPLGGRVTAEDVVQEVMWRALSCGLLQGFEDRGRGSLGGALRLVLDRTMADLGRRFGAVKRGASERVVSCDEGEDGAGGVPVLMATDTTPTSSARHAELLELCRRELDEREWEAWHLVEIRGLGAGEAAEILDSSPSAVRSLLFRARAKLVRALAGREGEG